MAKKRIHEIAKEQGIPSKDLLDKLQAAGLDVKAAASSVEEADALRALRAAHIGAPPGQCRVRVHHDPSRHRNQAQQLGFGTHGPAADAAPVRTRVYDAGSSAWSWTSASASATGSSASSASTSPSGSDASGAGSSGPSSSSNSPSSGSALSSTTSSS